MEVAMITGMQSLRRVYRHLAVAIAASALAACLCIHLASATTPATQTKPDAKLLVDDKVLIKMHDGGILSATIVRPRDATPLPTLLTLNIYTDPDGYREEGLNIAERGYVSVIADIRGKRLSPDPIEPYEHEADDAYDVIDWIAHQPWSNGKVGMLGGSYSGFTAWAATKHLHPALKTIAVSAAAIPGLGLPMYNNVFLNANYQWAFYVSNSKLLDNKVNDDSARWRNLNFNWFASGRPYQEIDQVDGTPNPFLHRWLAHPAYDGYWQRMVPYGPEFAHIGIPVLTITGYYDDGQISALHYREEHLRYRPDAQHYLVIGPYDHFGTHAATKAAELRDYKIDPVAQFSTPKLKLQWMDYVLKGGPKPALLESAVNYEVMGANKWRHVPSLKAMSPHPQTLFFSNEKTNDRYRLVAHEPRTDGSVSQQIDFANRQILHGFHTYPNPIVQRKLEYVTELLFDSEPFRQPTVVSGSFSGVLDITINKKDVDLTVTVYEERPDGTLFHLGYALQRASFAHDGSRRVLLEPGRATRVPFETTLVARQLEAASRLLVLLDVSMNPFAQVNYGTGKDVSTESVSDATEPLHVEYHNDSTIVIPVGASNPRS